MEERLLQKINDDNYFKKITRRSKSLSSIKSKSSMSILNQEFDKCKISEGSSDISSDTTSIKSGLSGQQDSKVFESGDMSLSKCPYFWKIKSYSFRIDKLKHFDFSIYVPYFTQYESLEERMKINYRSAFNPEYDILINHIDFEFVNIIN